MAGQQHTIYQNYVKSETKNNIEPDMSISGDEVFEFLRAHIADFDFHKPYSYTSKFWSNDSTTRVFKLDDGRIAEYARGSGWAGKVLLAVFENHDDWFNYRRPMGMFHYLYT